MWWHLEVGVSERWLGHEGGVLIKGVSVLIKETPKNPSHLPPTVWEDSDYGSEFSLDTESVGTLILDFQP